MARKAEVLMHDVPAGVLSEDEDGYRFTYYPEYIRSNTMAISLTLPLQEEPHLSRTLHPFFDGLIPEGWLLDVVERTWKVDPRDRMGLLMASCRDCIGAVSILPLKEEEK